MKRNIQSLVTIREHLKDAAEGHRKRLAALWEHGKQNTWLYKRLEEQYNIMQDKIDQVNEEILPADPYHNKKRPQPKLF